MAGSDDGGRTRSLSIWILAGIAERRVWASKVCSLSMSAPTGEADPSDVGEEGGKGGGV